jgi:hypothetical protein
LTALTQVLPGLSARLVNTTQSPSAAMADWLVSGDAPAGFSIDRDCELKAADGEKPVVRYARHALDLPEIREHIAAGKQPRSEEARLEALAAAGDGGAAFRARVVERDKVVVSNGLFRFA